MSPWKSCVSGCTASGACASVCRPCREPSSASGCLAKKSRHASEWDTEPVQQARATYYEGVATIEP
jgi:hypothetical protein